MLVLSVTRPITPLWSIYRESRTGRRSPVAHPWQPGAELVVHGEDASAAVRNARGMGVTGKLIAVREQS